MAVLARMFVVLFAYLLGCVAASLILTIGTLTPDWDELTSLGLQTFEVWSVIVVSAAIIATVAMLPAVLIIALAEGFGWRSALLYGAVGGVLALALSYGVDIAGYVDPGSALSHEREVVAAAGIAGGFVYWLFAGRRAGRWQ